MKKNLIALAVAGAIAAPAAAMADATVYGQVHLSYGAVDSEELGVTVDDNIQLRSHASRIGVKGSEDLGSGLAANYGLEWGINPDSNNNTGWSRRNQWIGLAGGFGEVRFGRHDTPLKMAQGKFDQFNDMDGDMLRTFAGEDRVDNTVTYLNNFGAFGVAVTLIPGEGDGTSTGDSFADSWSAAVTYTAGPLFLSGAYTAYDDESGFGSGSSAFDGVAGTTVTGVEDIFRLVATYNWNQHAFGLAYGQESNTISALDVMSMGASWKMGLGGGNAVRAQWTYAEMDDMNLERTVMDLGFDHAFSKKTSVYAVYHTEETEFGNTTVEEMDFIGVGMLMKF